MADRRPGRAVAAALTLAAMVLACSGPRRATSNCGAAEKPMESDVIKIDSNTQATLSGHDVGVANIWERDTPDDKGVVAPRVTATMAISASDSDQVRHLQVFAGSIVTLGADRYCVAEVAEGSSGFVTLRKLP